MITGSKISGRNAIVCFGPSAAGLYTLCDVAAKFEIDRKQSVEEVVTYCDVEPVFGVQTATIKGAIFVKKAAGGSVTGISVTASGSGYTSAPTVALSTGGGSGAKAVAIVDGGKVTNVFVISNGSGYTSAPTVTFTGGGGTNAAATAKLTGYNAEWLEPLFSGQYLNSSRIYYEIRPDGGASGQPVYSGYFIPTGWKLSIPESQGVWSFEFDGITNGWPVYGTAVGAADV